MTSPVDNWEIIDNKLFRRYEFKSFMDAIDFINKVEEEAIIKVITLAPELDGSEKFVKHLISIENDIIHWRYLDTIK